MINKSNHETIKTSKTNILRDCLKILASEFFGKCDIISKRVLYSELITEFGMKRTINKKTVWQTK